MSKKTKSAGRGRPILEIVIIVGLTLKLALTAGFLMWDQADNLLQPAEAHAQETGEPEEPSAEDQPVAAEESSPAPAAENIGDSPASQKALAKLRDSLAEREEAVKRREERLKEKEKALETLEKQISERMAEIDRTREKLENLVQKQEKLVEEQKMLRDARIEHLVTAYKGMRPEAAGNLINSMDDQVAVKILAAMPGRSAGLILANVRPEKAARLTKAISLVRKNQVKVYGDDEEGADNQ